MKSGRRNRRRRRLGRRSIIRHLHETPEDSLYKPVAHRYDVYPRNGFLLLKNLILKLHFIQFYEFYEKELSGKIRIGRFVAVVAGSACTGPVSVTGRIAYPAAKVRGSAIRDVHSF